MRLFAFVRWSSSLAQSSQQNIFRLLNSAIGIRNTLVLQFLVLAAEHSKQIINPVHTVTLFGINLRPDSSLIHSGRLRGGRLMCLRLWYWLLRFALGGITRRGDHITNAVWHFFKFLNTFWMNTGHCLKGWDHLVSKTHGKAFGAVQPGFIFQHCGNLIRGFSGFCCIGGDQHRFNFIQQISVVAHVVGIAAGKAPWLMDHHAIAWK